MSNVDNDIVSVIVETVMETLRISGVEGDWESVKNDPKYRETINDLLEFNSESFPNEIAHIKKSLGQGGLL